MVLVLDAFCMNQQPNTHVVTYHSKKLENSI